MSTEQQNGHPTRQDLQAEIEQTREELGATVDALSAKFAVKQRASRRIEAVRREHGQQVVAAVAGVSLAAIVVIVWRRRR